MPSDGDYLGSWDKLKNMVDDAGSKSAGRGAPVLDILSFSIEVVVLFEHQ